MSKRRSKKSGSIPEWIQVGKQATVIYEIFEAPFKSECDCDTCRLIREHEEFLGDLFRASKPPAGR